MNKNFSLQLATRFEIIEDRKVLHRADSQGDRIVRTQKIRDTVTGEITTVNHWANSNGRIFRVS